MGKHDMQVIVQPLTELPKDDPFWQMMQGICAARAAAGLNPRSIEEVEAQRRAIREEVDEEIERARRLQNKSERLRQGARDARFLTNDALLKTFPDILVEILS